MTREEMLKKLTAIQPTAFPTVATMDMGLQFDIITNKGAYTYLGAIGDWPLWKLPALEESKLNFILAKIKSNSLTTEDFEETKLYSFVQRMERRSGTDLNTLFAPLKNYTTDDGFYYIYCDLGQWEITLDFYNSEEELKEAFINEYSTELIPWNNMDEDSIASLLDEIDEYGEGVTLYEIDED